MSSRLLVVGFGLVAANIEIRNNMDAFISDLSRQSYWASMAAIFAAIAAMLQAIDYFWAGSSHQKRTEVKMTDKDPHLQQVARAMCASDNGRIPTKLQSERK